MKLLLNPNTNNLLSINDNVIQSSGSGKVLKNSTSGNVIEMKGNRLPSAYQEVEYVGTAQAGYCDMGIIPDSTTEAEYKISYDGFGTYGGHILSDAGTYFFPFYRTLNGGRWTTVRNDNGAEWQLTTSTNTIYTIKAFPNDNWYRNGTVVGSETAGASPSTSTLYLFNYHSSYQGYSFNGKMYYCKIWHNGALARDLVPCYRKADSVIGFYDLVNNQFYTNAGSGTFTKGNDVLYEDKLVVAPKPAKVVYGVSGLYNSSPTLTRTDDAVGMTWSMSNNEITSDFDNVFPYNQMVRETVDGNVMVYVPEIYWRFGKDSNGYITDVAISNYAFTAGTNQVVGHSNAFYYSAYKGSTSNSKLVSVSGASPTYSQTRATFRTRAQANGAGYQIMDIYCTNILKMLWLIEFATKDSESVMYGYTGYGRTTGATDNLTKPSGQVAAKSQMRWHYIEDFVGNGMDMFDGITGMYVTSNPSQYGDTEVGTQFTVNGSTSRTLAAYGFVDENNPLLFVPKATRANLDNASTTTYFCDLVNFTTGTRMYYMGTNEDNRYFGLFYWGNQASTFSYASLCSRIIKR